MRKNMIIITAIFFVMAFGVSAAWTYPFHDKNRTSFNDEETGNMTEFVSFVSTNIGSPYQPAIGDFDGDGNNEIVTDDGISVLEVLDEDLNEITYQTIGDPLLSVFDTTIENSTSSLISGVWGIAFYTFRYQNATITPLCSDSSIKKPETGVGCYDGNCYYGDNESNVVKIDQLNCSVSNVSTFADFNAEYGELISPVFSDIDRNGQIDMILVSINLSSAGEEWDHICSYNLATDSFNTGFGTNGCSAFDSFVASIRGIAAGNVDGGNPEIYLTAADSAGTGAASKSLARYDSTGSQVWSLTQGATKQNEEISNPILSNDDSEVGYINLDTVYIIYATNGSIKESYDSGFNTQGKGTMVSGGQLNPLTSMMSVASGGTIYSADLNASYNLTGDPATYVSYSNIVSDVDGDGLPELVGYKNGSIYISVPNDNNELPDILGPYGSVPSYNSPVCLNSTIMFYAQECDGSASCNYENDYSNDDERLVVDCYSGAPHTTGVYSSDNPGASCTYSSTGSYQARVYIQDRANDATYTEYRDIAISVIDGQNGVTCNLGSEVPQNTTTTTTGTETDMSAFDDIIQAATGNSTRFRFILAIGIILGFTIAIVSASHEKYGARGQSLTVIGGVSALLLTILVTALGLLPAYFLIILIVVAILGAVYALFVRGA